MKPMSGQILRIFASISHVYPLELAKNLNKLLTNGAACSLGDAEFSSTQRAFWPVRTRIS